MKKLKKENIVVLTATVFTVVAVLHLLRLVTGYELFVGDYSIPLWLSIVAVLFSGILVVLNLSLKQEKSKVFWLKYVLALTIFDGLFALYFWTNSLSCLGISPTSFSFIFVFDVVLVLFLSYYVNKMKGLIKK